MEKYITVTIPRNDSDNYIAWWNLEDVPRIIEILENNNPSYEFHQFVTSPGNGGYREYAIMKIR